MDVRVAYKEFHRLPDHDLDRPSGKVGLLNGQNNVNLHEKRRRVMTGPYPTVATLQTLDKEVFTKRKVLSIISSFYHPLRLISVGGLATPKTELKGAVVLGRTVNIIIPAMPERQGNIADLATRGKAC